MTFGVLTAFLVHDFLDPPYLPISEPDLDAMGVVRGPREDVLHHASCELPGPLVPLQDYQDLRAHCDVPPVPAVGLHGPPYRAQANL